MRIPLIGRVATLAALAILPIAWSAGSSSATDTSHDRGLDDAALIASAKPQLAATRGTGTPRRAEVAHAQPRIEAISTQLDSPVDVAWLRGDMNGAGVNVAANGLTVLSVFMVSYQSPYSLDWTYGLTGPVWWLDTNIDGVKDYAAVMVNDGVTVKAGILDAADHLVCDATPLWDAYYGSYTIGFDTSCIGSPAQLAWNVGFLYEEYFTGGTSMDLVPDSGWVGPVANDAYVPPTTVPTTTPATSPIVTAPATQPGGTASGCVASPIATPGAPSDGFTPVVPARLMDTRAGLPTVDCLFSGQGIRGGGTVTELTVAGRGGVPADASAVVLNVTATEGAGAGFVTVFPCGSSKPLASNLNFVTGEAIPNAVVAKIGTGGKVCLYTNVAVHLIVDVNGFFAATAGLQPVVPARLLDTRPGSDTVDGLFSGIGQRTGGTVTQLVVAGRGGAPADSAAVVLNVTATNAAAAGYVTVFPCGSPQPLASNLNFAAGDTIPNAVVSKVGVGGAVCFSSNVAVDLIVDVNGYFGSTAGFTSVVPARLLETRTGLATVDGQFNGIGLRAGGAVTELTVAGRGGVPADATAVVLNVTATDPAGAGYITVFPCGAAQPLASNLNFAAGDTIPNAVVAKVGTGGKVCLFSNVAVHLIVDVNGYYR
jgi:hypothetical protein